MAEKKKATQDLLREEVVAAYGGECHYCGETRIECLIFEPVKDNDAEEQRKFKGNVITLCKSIIERKFPKDEYRVLCLECSSVKGSMGYDEYLAWVERVYNHLIKGGEAQT